MPSRFSRGSSTNARARLEALLRVIDWLTWGLTTASGDSARFLEGATRRSRPGSDCAGDDCGEDVGGGGDDDEDGRPDAVLRPADPGSEGRTARDPLCARGGDDGASCSAR